MSSKTAVVFFGIEHKRIMLCYVDDGIDLTAAFGSLIQSLSLWTEKDSQCIYCPACGTCSVQNIILR